MTLDENRLAELHERGWTRVPGFVGAASLADMTDRIWTFLDGNGVRRDDPSTWPDTVVRKLQALRRRATFDAWLGPELDAIVGQLLGDDRWHTFGGTPQALVTMPTTEPWRLPRRTWHFDLPARGHTDRLDALRVFGLVTDVGPRGGGTVVVEGSPILVRRMVEAAGGNAGKSSDARKALARAHEFFAELGRPGGPDRDERLLAGERIDGVTVRVAEVTGAAGDLIVMDPWMLHNLNPNTSPQPRFAMSHMLYAADSALFATT